MEERLLTDKLSKVFLEELAKTVGRPGLAEAMTPAMENLLALPEEAQYHLWSAIEERLMTDKKTEPTLTCVRACFDLNTAHMPSTSPGFGGHRATKTSYGYVVYLFSEYGEDVEEPGSVPEWFRPIAEAALEHNCLLVNFDNDADMCEEFKDWEGLQ